VHIAGGRAHIRVAPSRQSTTATANTAAAAATRRPQRQHLALTLQLPDAIAKAGRVSQTLNRTTATAADAAVVGVRLGCEGGDEGHGGVDDERLSAV
jgi:hypothetical protein